MHHKDYLKYIVEEIHSTVFATIDSIGRPVTCAIDIMDYDESGLYFLTATGKSFYSRLKANENIAFTAIDVYKRQLSPMPVWISRMMGRILTRSRKRQRLLKWKSWAFSKPMGSAAVWTPPPPEKRSTICIPTAICW